MNVKYLAWGAVALSTIIGWCMLMLFFKEKHECGISRPKIYGTIIGLTFAIEFYAIGIAVNS